MNIILFLLVGFIVGALVAWLAVRLKYANQRGISQEELELKYVQKSMYDELKGELNVRGAELQTKVAECAELRELSRSLSGKLEENRVELEATQKKLQVEFENLANKILEEKSKKFVEINEEKIAGILNPLKERIQTFEKKVDETYSNETREKASLRKELELMMQTNRQMSDEAGKLTRALKGDSKVQGDWGEVQLEVLLEKSGLIRDIHYRKQENFKTEDGANVRPDYVVNLPEGKNFVLDCKVSLTAYERFCSADDEKQKAAFLSEHTASLARHITDLGSKSYQNLYGINPPDFVFLFIPVEPALSVALQSDPALFDKAFAKNVVLVSTSTLLATLRTITFIWKQENQKRNVLDIAKESGALYDKFVGFIDDLISVGKKINDAQDDYKAAMNKLTESSRKGDTIIGRIERIKSLGANTTKSIPQKLLDRVEDDIAE
ncbi:MAG: DNA recombination protein RmuC [Prevotellaceae bacterium]|jgi:DNA recombination protein RmuC|nr:DNA recombination protein RmuC [Prevotellaceae bacterium]